MYAIGAAPLSNATHCMFESPILVAVITYSTYTYSGTCFYDAFSQIDLANRPFSDQSHPFLPRNPSELPIGRPPPTRSDSSTSKGDSLHSNLKSPAAEARLRFASLVTINALDYKFKLTAAFQNALDDQEAAVAFYYTADR